MKQVTAVIKPHKLDPVHEALVEIGVDALSATEIKAFDRQMGHAEIHRGATYNIGFMPMVQIEAVVSDDELDKVVAAIREAGGTGSTGDGKIHVSEVQSVLRIHEGDVGYVG